MFVAHKGSLFNIRRVLNARCNTFSLGPIGLARPGRYHLADTARPKKEMAEDAARPKKEMAEDAAYPKSLLGQGRIAAPVDRHCPGDLRRRGSDDNLAPGRGGFRLCPWAELSYRASPGGNRC